MEGKGRRGEGDSGRRRVSPVWKREGVGSGTPWRPGGTTG
jgi:hypothetical protein